MEHDWINWKDIKAISQDNSTFINTILLGGTPAQKIEAARAAGFNQVEIWQQDAELYDGGPENLGSHLRELGLGVTDYQVLRNFDGAPDELREEKRLEALSFLEAAVEIGTTTILVTASADPACVANRVVDDLRWLVKEAALRCLRVAYEGLAWSTINSSLAAVWDCVNCVDHPNIGVVVDPFHIFVRAHDASDLDRIPIDRIYIVQLSDSDLHPCEDFQLIIDTARHRRLMPGQGWFPIHTIVERLKQRGYMGPIGIEVFSDQMKAQDPRKIAREAMLALEQIWPNE